MSALPHSYASRIFPRLFCTYLQIYISIANAPALIAIRSILIRNLLRARLNLEIAKFGQTRLFVS